MIKPPSTGEAVDVGALAEGTAKTESIARISQWMTCTVRVTKTMWCIGGCVGRWMHGIARGRES